MHFLNLDPQALQCEESLLTPMCLLRWAGKHVWCCLGSLTSDCTAHSCMPQGVRKGSVCCLADTRVAHMIISVLPFSPSLSLSVHVVPLPQPMFYMFRNMLFSGSRPENTNISSGCSIFDCVEFTPQATVSLNCGYWESMSCMKGF